jgi:predicted metal-dependent peptidase
MIYQITTFSVTAKLGLLFNPSIQKQYPIKWVKNLRKTEIHQYSPLIQRFRSFFKIVKLFMKFQNLI